MSKLTPEVVAKAAQQVGVDPEKRQALLEMLADLVATEGDEEKAPAIKKQFCVLVSDPEGRLPADHEFAAWVVQIPEEENVATTCDRIHRAAYEFNTTKRGRLLPAKTIGEALEHIPAKHFKEAQVWVKTKEPVLMLRTNNKIPQEVRE